MTDVILVTGMPNSGTTILRVILGNHAAIFAAGNLFNFPDQKYFAADKRCSCGSRVEDCEFWSDVRDTVSRVPSETRARFLYDRIAERSGATAVVDVAHDLHELYAALAVPGVRRKLIHIIREPDAVIRSRLGWDARRGRHGGTSWWQLKRVTKLGWRWRQQVRATEAIVRRLGPENAITLRYEQLGSSPREQISKLSALLGQDLAAITERIIAGRALAMPPHFVRGNGKIPRQEELMLQVDQNRATDQARWQRWLTVALTRSVRSVP